MGNGIRWTVSGKNVTEIKGDINIGVTVGAEAGKTIPVDIINSITGERTSINLTLAYSGEFGFTATLTLNVKAENAGYYANLFYYNQGSNKLDFVCAGQIDKSGNVELTFTHASDYTIVIADTVLNGKNTDINPDIENPEPTNPEPTNLSLRRLKRLALSRVHSRILKHLGRAILHCRIYGLYCLVRWRLL